MQRELRHIKDDYERQLREVLARLKEVQYEKRTLEDALDIARSNCKNEIRAQQEASASELRELQAKDKKLQQDGPSIKERIMTLKQDLNEIVVTEEHYFELKKIPEPERTIKD